MDQGFAAGERLHQGREFLRAYETGLRIRRPSFTMRVVSNGLRHSRLGMAVARAIGPAHVRNHVRRRLRDLFRRNKARIPSGLDLVVNAQAPIAMTSFQQLRAEFLSAISEALRRWATQGTRSASSSASSVATS